MATTTTRPPLSFEATGGDLLHAGVSDPRLRAAFESVPREWFVPSAFRTAARKSCVLPLPEGQSMPPAHVLLRGLAALRVGPHERVLEVGTGSGYGAALLGRLAGRVWSLELQPELAAAARQRLEERGLGENVEILCADGSLGLRGQEPFDAIIVEAAAPKVPSALLSQLAIGGRLVVPVGLDLASQELVRVRRCSRAHYAVEALGPIQLPPLGGVGGWSAAMLGTRTTEPG